MNFYHVSQVQGKNYYVLKNGEDFYVREQPKEWSNPENLVEGCIKKTFATWVKAVKVEGITSEWGSSMTATQLKATFKHAHTPSIWRDGVGCAGKPFFGGTNPHEEILG